MAESAFETARRVLQPADEQDEPVVEEYWLRIAGSERTFCEVADVLPETEIG